MCASSQRVEAKVPNNARPFFISFTSSCVARVDPHGEKIFVTLTLEGGGIEFP
jgi:hypothetical protein